MRVLLFLIALSYPLHADLIARFHTTQGNVDVVLQYATAPQAVANFITLAQGSRPWVDPFNGRIRTEPFYNGIKIHRIANNSGFKFAQGGSARGDGSDGPGYTFKDEFVTPLTHVPYVLSMANAGPNTNGSQFFFTGSLSQPTFNNVHTIFGLVIDPASRSVVDAMITAGNNGTTINEVTFTRTDPTAIAFNEFAQNLPVVTCPGGFLSVNRGVSAVWHLDPLMSTGAVFHAYRSSTMASGSWAELESAKRHVGISSDPLIPPVVVNANLDNAETTSAFYNLWVARHPGSVTPSTLANRSVSISINEGNILYAFNNSGAAGTMTYTPISGSPIIGPFTTVNPITGLPQSPTSNAHSVVFIADTPTLNPRYFWVKTGCDTASNSLIGCHYSIDYYYYNSNNPFDSNNYTWQNFTKGDLTITR
jgi:peptidyl-prolyl cis-trans isomerase A (cyclophilin A)